jgi:hypothetical protein
MWYQVINIQRDLVFIYKILYDIFSINIT